MPCITDVRPVATVAPFIFVGFRAYHSDGQRLRSNFGFKEASYIFKVYMLHGLYSTPGHVLYLAFPPLPDPMYRCRSAGTTGCADTPLPALLFFFFFFFAARVLPPFPVLGRFPCHPCHGQLGHRRSRRSETLCTENGSSG